MATTGVSWYKRGTTLQPTEAPPHARQARCPRALPSMAPTLTSVPSPASRCGR